MKRGLNAQPVRNAELYRGLEQAHVLEGVTGLMDLNLTPEEMMLSAARLLAKPLGVDYIGLLVFEGEGVRVVAAHQHLLFPAPEMSDAPPDWSNSVTRHLRELNQPHYMDDYLAGHAVDHNGLPFAGMTVQGLTWAFRRSFRHLGEIQALN